MSRPHTTSAAGSNVVVLRRRLSPEQRAYLAEWLWAGRRMGLLDTAVVPDERRGDDQVLVWVRENPTPAYVLHRDGRRWCVTDHLRQVELFRIDSFVAALDFIRPVLQAPVVPRSRRRLEPAGLDGRDG